jgi:NAD(P)-dependent dehydrogenase (short-subunit alcohol dehydrogenase family)
MGEPMAGRVALVTDGWHGIGLGITESFLRDGVTVAVGYNQPDPAVDDFLKRHASERLSLHQGSLAIAEDCQQAVEDVIDLYGRLDVLVVLLNYRPAGALSVRRALTRVPDRHWRRTIDIHLSGAFYVSQAALEHMVPAGFGRIIFVIGSAGVGDGHGDHATVRGALSTLTRELAREVAAHGVTVNRVQTGLIDDEVLSGLPAGAVDQATARIPVRRLGDPGEVSRAVNFLAHPDAGYLTGQLLAVDGGMTLDTI